MTIDGQPVANLDSFRVISPEFTFSAPSPWIFGNTGGEGTSVGDGYYLFLTPLSRGTHTIHMGGDFHFSVDEGDPFDFDAFADVTYVITVNDRPPIRRLNRVTKCRSRSFRYLLFSVGFVERCSVIECFLRYQQSL